MIYELHNQTTHVSRKYSKQFWAKALELAKLYGWEPMGTRLPCQDVGWLGAYLTNDGQTVIAGDAYMLALAVEKAMIEESLQDGLLDIIGVNPLEYFAGDEKYDLTQFIRFCRLGSFRIL